MNLSRRRSPLLILGISAVAAPGWPPGGLSLSYSVGGKAYPMSRSDILAGVSNRPIVVLLHGIDGLSELSRPQIESFAGELDAQGYAVFVPTYFDSNDGTLTDLSHLDSVAALRTGRVGEYGKRVAAAVQVARAEADVDPLRVALVGFSLGGGLALERAEASTGEVKAVVDFFGYLGSPSIAANAANLPPTLVFHNHADEIVPASNSKTLMDSLDRTSVPHDVHFLHDEGGLKHHPFKPKGEADEISRLLTLRWLKKYL
ncbi:dienelactone hydrolase family protein [Paludisphaera rhizosphaerae]|uniref:dienelactone hydrolase family protein n=1 Tax=Paludisphaera rhizosphaerae TaxID=2711216 RepID=UPI0013EB705D|nr:dienelactone hydrolase family protein [Paludisphaera rhizosphaerae]